ncbi:MAG: DEAD/DEAH box helicase [Gammaproteobacteria bacterium]|nr:DEAD/DEAH box helicase [Gammaproteobacteria bacterium]
MSETSENFAAFGLPPFLMTALEAVGYETPSPIQAAAIPVLMQGQDLIGQAQTGTGKTAAFALPLLARLDMQQREPQVLVLTPTRELAIQVAEAFQSYARHLPGFHVVPIYGGQSMVVQLRALQRPVHVIVGTPGRVMDHLRRESLKLGKLRALILDEADEMLRMGFLEEVTWILEHTPPTRQTGLFSATMPEPIRVVARNHLREPQEIKIKSKTSTVEAVHQRYWQVAGLHKLDALTRILEIEEIDAALVFVRTKTATVELAEKLEARGYPCAALNGDLNQAQREKTIDQLKNNHIDIVIATDVAARGLDVPRISHVINYDIPHDIEGYVHRIGRTARAGRTGVAILFVAPREMRMLRAIEHATKQPIEAMRTPSLDAIVERRVVQFKQAVIDTVANENLEFFGGLVDQMAHEQGVEPREIAAALSFMVQRDRPLRLEAKQREAPPPPFREERAPRGTRSEPPRRERPAAPPTQYEPRRDHHEPRQEGYESQKARTTRPPLGARPAPLADSRPPPPVIANDVELVRYRIDIGVQQGATPKHIVGAIANEAGIDSRYIGRIEIFDDFSTVDLPDGMPREVLQHLKKVRLGKHRFNLALLTEPQIKGLAELSAESAQQRRGSLKPRKKRHNSK